MATKIGLSVFAGMGTMWGIVEILKASGWF